MTKLREFSDPSVFQSKVNYVNAVWAGLREARQDTLTRITGYLFVLNTGALLAALTYVASKNANGSIQISIWLFAAGIACSVAHAAIDYYVTEGLFGRYQKDVDALYRNSLDWETLVERVEKHGPLDWLLHALGWIGGLAFFLGLLSGLHAIPVNEPVVTKPESAAIVNTAVESISSRNK